jgi:hypothetical protein
MTTDTTSQATSVPDSTSDKALRLKFNRLARQWKEQTEFMSSSDAMVAHPAYQSVIGMGPAALPLLLEELERDPDHWFWALKAISEEDPVPAESRGNVQEMTRAWLGWGREKGLRR